MATSMSGTPVGGGLASLLGAAAPQAAAPGAGGSPGGLAEIAMKGINQVNSSMEAAAQAAAATGQELDPTVAQKYTQKLDNFKALAQMAKQAQDTHRDMLQIWLK